GTVVSEQEGISVEQQRKLVLRLSRELCIHPFSIYQFRLYRDPHIALDYIYPHETMALHRDMNREAKRQDLRAMQDKIEFRNRSLRVGLPVVETIQHFSREDTLSVEDLTPVDEAGVFLKTRTGHNGNGAFSLQFVKGRLLGHMLQNGVRLQTADEVNAALAALLREDDVILQPLLKSHPSLALLGTPYQSVMLRTITRKYLDEFRVCSAFLRTPLPRRHARVAAASGLNPEVLAKVDLESGKIFAPTYSSLSLVPSLAEFERLAFNALKSTTIPYWHEISGYSCKAHEEYSSLWAVAWDWLITPEQPMLLEGNVYWGVQKSQELFGGMARSVTWIDG
ncbi:MAG: sugar-transfer associated ATP-grasp domain-containing protein, partial [Pseudomonadota bacterium]